MCKHRNTAQRPFVSCSSLDTRVALSCLLNTFTQTHLQTKANFIFGTYWEFLWFCRNCIVSVDWKETGVRLEYEYLPPNANTNGWSWGWFTLHRSTTLEMLHDHIITRCMLQLKKKHAGNSITGFNSVVLSIKPFIHFKCCGANIPECHCQSSPPESVSWTNKRRQCGSVDSALEGVWITATLATVCPNFLSRCITTRNGWIVQVHNLQCGRDAQF